MKLELERPAEALKELEATMAKERNRPVGICQRADKPGRAELQEAQKAARSSQ